MTNKWQTFTEHGYRDCLASAAKNYRFINYLDTPPHALHVIWRHDVDCSVHRALKIAKIESEMGVQSTFFFMLTSPFYNLLEPAVKNKVLEIISLKHDIGLHFDFSFFGNTITDEESLEAGLLQHQAILQNTLDVPIRVFSFHNPDTNNSLNYKKAKISGMVNAYGETFSDYKYCSDSNGYWRFEELPKVLESAEHSKLHVLTHPEWWTPEPLPPYQRILRCVDGRRTSVIDLYENIMKASNRKNIDD
jgi:hypothetical protein